MHEVVRQYGGERSKYGALAKYVADLIERAAPVGIIHTVEDRAKDLSSFEKKCQKTNEDGTLRYPNAPDGITDLAGVRIIVFTRDSVDLACELVHELFDVFEMEDVGDRVYQKRGFGYQSKHLLIRLGDDRKNLKENKDVRALVCEIQVRTILQHAWAELEHDIQYKTTSDIPVDLSKRFSALAGLLELADREFQNIQNESAAVKDRVKADLLSDLTREGLSQQDTTNDERDEGSTSVRELITQGKISDAMQSFDEKIKKNPSSYTHYIGRGKTRFLAGDVRGALSDLDSVDQLVGNDRYTERLRNLIERGDTKQIAHSYRMGDQIAELQKGAGDALSAGDGVKAFERFEELEAAGYNRALILYGKAVCCALERDATGAANFITPLEVRPGTIMAINLHALLAIIAILSQSDPSSHITNLGLALDQTPQYTLSASPLKSLFEGLAVKQYPEQQQLSELKKVLEKLVE